MDPFDALVAQGVTAQAPDPSAEPTLSAHRDDVPASPSVIVDATLYDTVPPRLRRKKTKR